MLIMADSRISVHLRTTILFPQTLIPYFPGRTAPAQASAAPARNAQQLRRSWTASRSLVVVRGRLVPRVRRRAPRGSRRPARGPRCRVSGTPTQTSCFGTCSRVSGDQTTGMRTASASHPDRPRARGRMARMPRARDLGIEIGALPTGPTNSVLDVAGVGLGHATIHRDEPAPPRPRVARTGVTVPGRSPRTRTTGRCRPAARCSTAPASAPGFLTAAEWGAAETPVYLTSTHAARPGVRRRLRDRARAQPVGRRRRGDPGRRRVRRLVPQRLPPDARHRGRRPRRPARPPSPRAARRRHRTRARSGPGRACPASTSRAASVRRRGSTAEGHTVAVLLHDELRRRARSCVVAGVPVGRLLGRRRRTAARSRPARASGWSSPTPRSTAPRAPGWPGGSGSAWPAPARSPTTAAARSSWASAPGCGSTATAGPTARRLVAGRALDPLFAAVVEAAEEAVLNSMFTAPDDRRPRRQHQRVAALPARCSRSCEHAGRDGHAAGGPHPGRGRRRARRDAVPPRPGTPGRSRACSRRCPTARTT